MLTGKKILIGVSGGIAAYKIPLLIRLLVKEGALVRVVMTKDAESFVTQQTLSVLSKNKVETEFFDENFRWNNHVELGLWADLILIAPATAKTLAKMAHGLCDNLLLATYMSSRCKVVIAPAMDADMYLHFSTSENLSILKNNGAIIIEPNYGELASGLIGKGRMQEPEIIFSTLNKIYSQIFSKKKILINAGPTYESIDPVRFIGNRSSGKTGVYLAECFALLGAKVTLITGPINLKTNDINIEHIKVETANQMFDACIEQFKFSNIFIAAAAVADYRPIEVALNKIKKNEEKLTIELVKNRDILYEAGRIKTAEQMLIGFALETENVLDNAKQKLRKKNLDMIIVNSPNNKDEGFGHDTNKITVLDKHNKIINFELMDKREIAYKIALCVSEYLSIK